ncbi:permease [Oleiagrimonas sp. MCCC 1A03011]|nr:permease [Oleiagrimonas sp. MCCC 1A03011]
MPIWMIEIVRSWRASVRRPGFLLLASGVLALGIGASVAVFTLIEQTLLKPLPIPQASRVVMMGRSRAGSVGTVTVRQYRHMQSLPGVASIGLAEKWSTVNVAGDGDPALVPAVHVTPSWLSTLGVVPRLGRNFTADEARAHGPHVVILGHGFWQRRFAGRADAIGRSLRIEGARYTIVGVLPARYDRMGFGGDVMLPFIPPPEGSVEATSANQFAVARLNEGVGLDAMSARLDARIHGMYRQLGSHRDEHTRFIVRPLSTWLHADARPVLLLFLGSALCVLMIALVNLTNLMLTRALLRQHDAAVRGALGAPRLRQALPTLAEGALVGLLGAGLGIALAELALALAQGWIPDAWRPQGILHPALLASVLGIVVGVVGAVLAAALGLWRSLAANALETLREGGRNGLNRRSRRLGRVLVVIQVALATALLSSSGMLLHTLYDAAHTPLGFSSQGILTFELKPVKGDYPDTASVLDLSRRLQERLHAVAGVTQVAMTTNLPSGVGVSSQLEAGMQSPDGPVFNTQFHAVSPGFFKLFGIRQRKGRLFASTDAQGAEAVAVVSASAVKRGYDGHALGQQIQFGGHAFQWSARIVGVVDDTHQYGPLKQAPSTVYVPLQQIPDAMMKMLRKFEPLRVALRVHGDPQDYRARVRQAVADIAPQQPIAQMRTMRAIVHGTTAAMRLNLTLIGIFAVLALLLAAAGLYAVMSVTVAAREREFGVRMALGSSPIGLTGLVLRGGLLQIAIGLALGVILALSLSGVERSVIGALGNRSLFDPLALSGVCLTLLLAGLMACLAPGLRASRVQPMRALRGE